MDIFVISKGQVRPQTPCGNRPPKPEVVQQVRDLLERYRKYKKTVSMLSIAKKLSLSATTVWRIARKQLKWYPYKPHTTVKLTDQNKAARASAGFQQVATATVKEL